MWKLLYQLASPKTFYAVTGRWLPWFAGGALLFIIMGLILGLGFAPPDYQQGEAFRIIYVHVPCAFLSMALYAGMGFCSLLLLVWRFKMAGILLTLCAQLGATMTLLALITGSLWGKPMWGTWWIWDARLTAELILLLLYGAILAVGHAYQHQEKADKMVAILTLVGLIDLPIIHYSVYWWNTLHQGATVLSFARPKIAASMAYPLYCMLLGFIFYSLFVILYLARQRLLQRERRQSWVRQLINGDLS